MNTNNRHPRYIVVIALGIMLGWLPMKAGGQPSPTNFRSGTTDTAGDLFTVPAGDIFVLTDLQWSDGNTNQGFSVQMRLRDNTSVRWRWRSCQTSSGGNTKGTLDSHWATGIVFDSENTLRFEIDAYSGGPWSLNWSGFLVPNGTSRVETPSDAHERSLAVYPNPSDGIGTVEFTSTTCAPVSIAIFYVTGRRVRTVYDGNLAVGRYAWPWDGRDDAGNEVSAGTYFAQALGTMSPQPLKVVRTR